MRFRRTEAIDCLGISKTKFDRLVRDGKIAVERDATELLAGKPAVYVTLAELGRYLSITDDAALRVRLSLPAIKPAQPEPQPEPEQTAQPVEQAPEQESFTPRQLTPFEQRELDDLQLADEARNPEWRDSFGHKLAGNKRHSMIETQEHIPQDTQAHMDPALVGGTEPNTGVAKPWHGEGFTRSGEPLAAGLSQETYDAMMRDWNRTHHGWDRLSMSEQREAVENSRTAIASAFPRSEYKRSADYLRKTEFTPNNGRPR